MYKHVFIECNPFQYVHRMDVSGEKYASLTNSPPDKFVGCMAFIFEVQELYF